MWFFGKKNKINKLQNKAEKTVIFEQKIDEKCLKIAKIISNNDTNVMTEIRESFATPKKYIDKYYEHRLTSIKPHTNFPPICTLL